MLHERAIAICIPLQKPRRLHTRGSKMPSGKKSMTLPLALCTQNARAVEPLDRIAEEQVSDARMGWRSIPIAASAGELKWISFLLQCVERVDAQIDRDAVIVPAEDPDAGNSHLPDKRDRIKAGWLVRFHQRGDLRSRPLRHVGAFARQRAEIILLAQGCQRTRHDNGEIKFRRARGDTRNDPPRLADAPD